MRDAGKDVPALDRRKAIVGYQWLWQAFHDLTTCRAGGMGIYPIPWTATQRYAEVTQLSRHDTYLLHVVIKAMDEKYREHCAKQEKK